LAPPRDLRDWIALLEREGELKRIAAEVDPDLEITEITDRVVKSGGPALLFERPKRSQHPLLINQFGTERRMCLALGVHKLDAAAAKLGEILDMQPPQGLREKVRGLLKLKSVADSLPKTVSKAPTSTSPGSLSSAAGRATPRPSSRCPRSSRRTPTPASATSACIGCK
jgi:4-hydroxy-3-polyprenylbenzoate decarboxylase